jgi:hypothetical protein
MPNPKTPEERSEIIAKRTKKAKKGYYRNNKKKVDLDKVDLDIVKTQLVALKMIGGYSDLQCSMIVGISKGQVREIVRDPNFKKHVDAVKKSLPQAAINLGQAYLVEAVLAVVHVMRTETDNALVLRAAAEMFDRFGIAKVSKSEMKIDTPADGSDGELTPDLMTKLRSASPEVQKAVADLTESFTEGVEAILSGGNENGPDASA